jgi:lactate racemase
MLRIESQKPIEKTDLVDFVESALAPLADPKRRVLVIVPDNTRSVPLPVMFDGIVRALHRRCAKLDFLIALGTHPPMTPHRILDYFDLSYTGRMERYGDIGIFNHDWQNPDVLRVYGRLDTDTLRELTGGLLTDAVDVRANRMLADYDHIVVVSPVFPHEVAGFSGGNKYFFPGVSGPEILNLFHWLGALISNPVIIGTKDTPVRRVIDAAAALIPTPRTAFCMNVNRKDTLAVYYGHIRETWSAAADAAAKTHIREFDEPFDQVLAVCPEMYDELWVAGKCMYKLESVVADGGELIIYAPHLKEISKTHGAMIRRIGYHTRDYFLARMGDFRDIPGGVLAHSTHVRGIGTFHDGVEHPRVRVTLASGIPERECRAINLGYHDPETIDVDAWRDRPKTLVVDHAGEVLHRLKANNPRPEPVGAEM